MVNDYDDQYKLLAHHILAVYSKAEVKRILVDDEFIYHIIIKETRLQDFSGAFLDCIIQSILDDKRRMDMCRELDKLSKYFFSELDLARLRKELEYYATKYGII